MKAIKRLSLIAIVGLMLSGCFESGKKKSNPFSSSLTPDSSETISSSETSSEAPSSSSSSSSESKYSHNPGDTLVTSVKFTNHEYSMNVNKNITILTTVLPEDATNKKLVWSSSDTSIATVDKNGKVHSVYPGTVTITAMSTDGTDVTDSALVTVNAIEVTNIKLTKSYLKYDLGNTFYINYTLTPSNASFKKIDYEIEDETILKVDDNGLFTPIGVGTTKVTLRTSNPSVYAVCDVDVKDVKLYGFEFKDEIVELHPNQTYTLDAYYYPKNAKVLPTTYTSSNPSVASVDETGLVTTHAEGSAIITATAGKTKTYSDTIQISVFNNEIVTRTPLRYGFKEKFDNSAYYLSNSPSIGDVNYLVVPVWFTDSNNYITDEKKEDVRADITNAFFGTNQSCGWRSVRGFYEEESYGRLHLSGKVTKWYNVGLSTSTVSSSVDTRMIGEDVLTWYKKEYPQDSLSDYDYDKDGVIDALIMIYACPTDGNAFWAYCSLNSTTRASLDDDPNLGTFMWASYAFMYGYYNIGQRTGVNASPSGDTRYCTLDTHTYIHETGHLLGADDYYDYANNRRCPAGGFTMQDYDWGRHDPFSTMCYGWTDPMIPTDSCEITIAPFEKTGDLVVLTPNWNRDDSPFDEYIALEYFTPTGVNEFDAVHGHQGITIDNSGVRIWHIDGRLAYTASTSFNISQLTTHPEIKGYRVEYAFSNTHYEDSSSRVSVLGQAYGDYNLLQLIRNYNGVDYKNRYSASQNDFYYEGDTFTIDGNREKGQFIKTGKLNSGLDLGWKVEFKGQNANGAKLKITRL